MQKNKDTFKNLFIHFDFVKDTSLTVGALLYKTELEMTPIEQNVLTIPLEQIPYENNFHASIRALHSAIVMLKGFIEKNNLSDVKVKLFNQNRQIFDWLRDCTFSPNYEQLYLKIFEDLAEILDRVDLEYKVIEGKHNKAKKALKSKAKAPSPAKETYQKLDLNYLKNVLSQHKEETTEDRSNVVPIKRVSI